MDLLRNMTTTKTDCCSLVGFLLVWSIFSIGCGEGDSVQRVDISGNVKFRGAPIPKGRIDFFPDASKGNSGPAGYAVIEQGTFNTQSAGRGPIQGPQRVRIVGFDGIREAVEEGSEMGKPLFEAYETTIDIKPEEKRIDLEVSAKS
jgi:hypothetical protein